MRGNKTSKKYEKITISFTEADSDIIEYVRELKKSNKASEFIREAIREKIDKTQKESKIESIVEELESRIDYLEKALSINADSKNKQEVVSQIEGGYSNFNKEENKNSEVLETTKEEKIDEIKKEVYEEFEEKKYDDFALEDDVLNAIEFFDL